MDWLLVIAQMCQVSVSGNVSWSSEEVQKKCQRQLIECVGQPYWAKPVHSSELAACILKRAKGELK